MKKMAQFATFFMVTLILAFFVSSVKLPELKNGKTRPVNIAYELENDGQDGSESEEDSTSEIEFHDSELYHTELKFVFTPDTRTRVFLTDLPVFVSSYMHSIYVPPLMHVLS